MRKQPVAPGRVCLAGKQHFQGSVCKFHCDKSWWAERNSLANGETGAASTAVVPKLPGWTQDLTILGMISLAGWALGYCGQPHVVVRFMALRRREDVRVSRRIALVWSSITMASAVAIGAAFGPVLLLSLFWRGMNRNGALAGLIVGAVTVAIWKPMTGGPADIFDMFEVVPGFVFFAITVFIVSLATDGAREAKMFDGLMVHYNEPKSSENTSKI